MRGGCEILLNNRTRFASLNICLYFCQEVHWIMQHSYISFVFNITWGWVWHNTHHLYQKLGLELIYKFKSTNECSYESNNFTF